MQDTEAQEDGRRPNSIDDARLLRRSLSRCSNKSEVNRFLKDRKQDEIEFVELDWLTFARLNQLPTEDGHNIPEFRVWMVLGGRGAGKTRAGAEWVRHQALGLAPLAAGPARRIALVGPTLAQVRSVMIEGVSGLLSLHSDGDRPSFEPSLRHVRQ